VGQILFIECAEDVDLGTDSEVIANQLKARAQSISLNTDAAMEAVRNFWTLKALNQPRALRFNYITTGPVAQEEKAVSSKDNRKGLEVWESAKTSEDDANEIRNFLLDIGEGRYPDADMLPLGMIRQGKGKTHFTPDEQVTLMTLWCIVRSPLIFGGDLRKMDDATLALITNARFLRSTSTAAATNKSFVMMGRWRG
jgi:hypothetical protein